MKILEEQFKKFTQTNNAQDLILLTELFARLVRQYFKMHEKYPELKEFAFSFVFDNKEDFCKACDIFEGWDYTIRDNGFEFCVDVNYRIEDGKE